MLRRLYDRTLALAAHRHAERWLAAAAFAESSFFPIPPDALLMPMVLARPERAWAIAGICTVMSVLGGLFGYAIGYFLFETVGRAVIDFYDYGEAFADFQKLFDEWGLWVVAIAGFTPMPYKVATIASGVAKFDLWAFVLASLVTRGARFYLVAGLLKVFGPPLRGFIERYLALLTTVFALLIVAGFLALKYL